MSWVPVRPLEIEWLPRCGYPKQLIVVVVGGLLGACIPSVAVVLSGRPGAFVSGLELRMPITAILLYASLSFVGLFGLAIAIMLRFRVGLEPQGVRLDFGLWQTHVPWDNVSLGYTPRRSLWVAFHRGVSSWWGGTPTFMLPKRLALRVVQHPGARGSRFSGEFLAWLNES